MPLCPHCQQEIPADSVYCSRCGQALGSSPPSTDQVQEPAAPVGELPLGAYLKTGWELFKTYPAGFVGFTLLYFLIGAAMHAVPKVGWLAFFMVQTPLAAGFFLVHGRLLKRQPVEFSHFFGGFRSHLLIPLILLGVVSQTLITLGLLLLLVPGIYLAVSYLFAPLFLLDQGRDFWPAMEASRQTVTNRWFSFFGFFLLLVLINLGGALLFGVGLLVTIPVSYGAVLAAYEGTIGLKSSFT